MNRAHRIVEISSLGLILILALYLRSVNVENTPGYYSDEGTILEIAGHLQSGKWQYMALNQSTLLVARMPLFPLLLAAGSSVLGEGIRTLRLLTAMLGGISVVSTYFLGHRLGGRRLAFAASTILAIYPMAVIYSRLGFSYNLLAALTPIVGLMTLRFMDEGRSRYLVYAGLLIGLGALSDLLMSVFLVPILLIASTRGRRVLPGPLIAAAVPVAGYVGYMLTLAGDAFLFDLRFTLSRLSEIPWYGQFPVAAFNYARLLEFDPWLIGAIIGVFVTRPMRSRWYLLLLLLLPILLIGRTVSGLAGLGYYYLIPTLPFASIGIAALVIEGIPRVHQVLHGGLHRLLERWGWPIWLRSSGSAFRWTMTVIISLGLFVFVFSPFVVSAMASAFGIHGNLSTPIDVLLVDPIAATTVASYVGRHTTPDELVIASPAVAWLIDSRVSDFQLSIAAGGVETVHLPGDLPDERLEYDVTPAVARFVIVDPIWRNWAAKVMPEVAELVREVEAWPLRLQISGVQVYENPYRSLNQPH